MRAAPHADRVRFGVDGLDAVLGGGLVRRNHLLIEGPAGAGKTSLSLAFLHAGAAAYDEPGLLVSFELSPAKLLRDAAGFGWDFDKLVRQRRVKLIETSPEVLLQDLRFEDGVLAAELSALGAKRLVIDGLTPLRLAAEGAFRTSLMQLVAALERLGVTAVVTSESDDPPDPQQRHERFVFDAVVQLGHAADTGRRWLQVTKARGQDFVSGRHTLRVEAGRGAVVYQAAQSRHTAYLPQARSEVQHSFGAAGIDQLFGGGLFDGSLTMVSGIAGTGKTVAGLQFLVAGAACGDKGLFVSADEPLTQLSRNAEALELPVTRLVEREQLFMLYEAPLSIELDVHFHKIVALIDEHGIKRLVLDSLALYEKVSPDAVTGFLYALCAFCKARGVVALLNYESPELLGISQISDTLSGSQLVDNIVLLSYVEVSTTLRRAIAVPKVRGSHNPQVTREYCIGRGGLSLMDEPIGDGKVDAVPQLPFSSYYGLLARAPARHSPVIEEAIASGEPLPESAVGSPQGS